MDQCYNCLTVRHLDDIFCGECGIRFDNNCLKSPEKTEVKITQFTPLTLKITLLANDLFQNLSEYIQNKNLTTDLEQEYEKQKRLVSRSENAYIMLQSLSWEFIKTFILGTRKKLLEDKKKKHQEELDKQKKLQKELFDSKKLVGQLLDRQKQLIKFGKLIGQIDNKEGMEKELKKIERSGISFKEYDLSMFKEKYDKLFYYAQQAKNTLKNSIVHLKLAQEKIREAEEKLTRGDKDSIRDQLFHGGFGRFYREAKNILEEGNKNLEKALESNKKNPEMKLVSIKQAKIERITMDLGTKHRMKLANRNRKNMKKSFEYLKRTLEEISLTIEIYTLVIDLMNSKERINLNKLHNY